MVNEALQAISDELDVIGDALGSINSKLDQLLAFAASDAKAVRVLQTEQGKMADRLSDLERPRYASE